MTPKPVTTTQDPSIAWAESLWKRLEAGLFDTQNTIIAIIEAKAWEPLGYESFSKAWVDRIMSRITIASELRPHVVYQMFSEGLTPDQVADAVKGLGPDKANLLKDQYDNGVTDPDQMTMVRRHPRKLPDQDWGYLKVKVAKDTLKEWKQLSKANDMSLEDFALEIISSAFDDLA